MSEVASNGALIARGLELGWIQQDQARAAWESVQRARDQGRGLRIGQALVALGALSQDRVLELLEACGWSVAACPRCRQAWNVPCGSAPACPNDGAALQPSRRLDVLGELARSAIPAALMRSGSGSASGSGTRVDDGLGSDRYKVERELARGGMGAVWLARDHFLGRDVAMKVMLKQGRLRTLRFLEEARVTGQLDHPNIVPVHELGRREDGRHFFTMKWVKGEALSVLIARDFDGHEDVSLRRSLEIFTKILDAVAYAHAHEVIHRDLKPDNIMIGEFGEVYVMDWGLAKVRGRRDLSMEGLEDEPAGSAASSIRSLREAGPQWTLDGALCGTLNYMPPEQADRAHSAVDERSDIYALGAILFEMLTGRPAFDAPTVPALVSLIFTNQYADPDRGRDGRAVPPELAAVVRKALALKPRDRYRSVLELRGEIEAFLDGRAVRARRDPTWTRIRRWSRRHAFLVSALSLALVSLAVLGLILFALPARLRLEVPDPPAGLQVSLDGAALTIERRDSLAIARAQVWPPGAVELRASAPGHDPAELRLSLDSRARETRLLRLRRWTAPLTIASSVGGLEARLSPAGEGASEPIVLDAPFYERALPAGDYRLELGGLDRFPLKRDLALRRGIPARIDAELEGVVLAEIALREPIIDGRLADLNEDGRLELILALRGSLEVLDLGSRRLLWRRSLVRNQERLRSRGNYLEVADIDGDGRCDIIAQDDSRIFVFDGATGDEKGRFPRFLCRIRAVDIEGDGRAEIICATPYRGVQAFRGDGQRVWATQTPRYSDHSGLQEVALGGEEVGLIGLALRPAQLYALERKTGAVLWRRAFDARPYSATVSVFASGRGYDLIAVGALDALIALDARDGREVWRQELPGERVIGVTSGRFRQGEPPVLLVHTRSRIRCFNRAGKELWRHEGAPQRCGAFGDVDGDGVHEWVVFIHDEDQPDRWSLRALSVDGATLRRFAVSKDSEDVAPIAPWVVDAYGDGLPCLLVLDRYRVRLIKLGPERGAFQELPEGFDYRRFDLDGDGRLERVVYNSKVCEVSGATLNWRISMREVLDLKAFRSRAVTRLDPPEVADCDGDGVEDFCFGAGGAVVVISGRDGRPLLVNRRESLVDRPFPGAPLRDGRRLVYALTGQEVMALELDPEKRDGRLRFRVPYTKSDCGGAAIGGSRPGLVHCDRGTEVVRRDRAGNELWRRDLGDIISFGGLLVLEDRILAPASHGEVVALDYDGRLLWRSSAGSSANILTRRRGPEGDEVLVLGWSQVLTFVEPRRGRVLHRFEAPELAGLGSWQVSAADIDGDRVDEVFVITAQGHLTVLDGRSLERVFSTQRLLIGLDSDVRKVSPPAVADWDGDGRPDLLVHAQRAHVLFDLPRQIRRFRRPRFSDDPLVDMSYMLRELLRGDDSVVPRRLAALGRGGARSLGRGLAARYGVAENGALGFENHRAALLAAVRAGQALSPFLERTRGLFADKLMAVFRFLDRGELSAEEKKRLEDHIREAMRGQSPDALLVEARRRGDEGREADRRTVLEVAARTFPEDEELRRRYIEAVGGYAAARHLSFDRTGPMELLGRAVAVLDDPRLRVLLARITLSRLPNEPERAAEHFDRAVALGGPHSARSRAHRALFYFQTRRAGPAMAELERSLREGQEDGVVRAIAGLLMAYQRRPTQALAHFQRALALGIEDPLEELEARVYRARFELFLAANRPLQARRDFEAMVLKQGPTPRDNLDKRRLGVVLCRSGRFAEGLPLLRDASVMLEGPLRLEVEREYRGFQARARSQEIARPEGAAELAIFARAALFEGRIEEGRSLFKQALGLAEEGEKAALLSELGRFELRRGARDRGVELILEALASRGDGPEARVDRLALASAFENLERDRARRLILEAIAAGARQSDLRDRGLNRFLEDPAILAAFQK